MARHTRQFPVVNPDPDAEPVESAFIEQAKPASINGGLQGAEIVPLPTDNSYPSLIDGPLVGGPGITEGRLDAPPSDSRSFCCMVGPCRHYQEWMQHAQTADPFDWFEIKRVCRNMLDEEGHSELTDETIYACSEFRPPWYSIRGLVYRIVCRHRLRQANRMLQSGQKPEKGDLDPWWFRKPTTTTDEQIEEETTDARTDTD